MKSTKYVSFLIVLFLISKISVAQDCTSLVSIKLKNVKGGFYSNQLVTLTGRSDGKTFSAQTNGSGEVNFSVPCDQIFDVNVANYPRKKEILSAKSEGAKVSRSFSYEPDVIAKDKLFEMNEIEKAAVDSHVKSLSDTISLSSSDMDKPENMEFYSQVAIGITDLDRKPLAHEHISIVGEKHHKKLKAITDKNGYLLIYLPKGDKYYINFKYNHNFISYESAYSKGSSKATLNFAYLGTKEIERRKKEEVARIALEEKRIKEGAEAFAKKCKKLGISVEEGKKREAEELMKGGYKTMDTVVTAALRRNCWSEKLIVCDLTGSMSPYAAQLSAWYQLSYKKEKNLQFVFFNDGDNMPDQKKKIGSTGGIYYSSSNGIDSLFRTIAKVSSRGWGGDCPENNMEALIKGVKFSKPYKELVMIADNNAPVKDISLLKDFDAPVHIILCGVYDGILADYLKIAKKTNGSIHTMEEDITKLALMSEGQEIKIGKSTYQIMGGEFVKK